MQRSSGRRTPFRVVLVCVAGVAIGLLAHGSIGVTGPDAAALETQADARATPSARVTGYGALGEFLSARHSDRE